MDPCGTPVFIYLKPDSLTLYLTYCFCLICNFSIILVLYPLFRNTVVYIIKYQSLVYQMLLKDQCIY